MDELKIPNHVAIIMDGNGRWATNRGLKRSEGHKEGSKTLEKVAIHAINKGVKVLSVYAFSTDNFKRTKEEVDYLMNLFILMFKTKFKVIDKENIKVIFSGRREPLSKSVLDAMDSIVKKTENNTKGILNICLNYGGHIGDGVRPSERRKGYATKIIGLALKECQKLNIDKVLLVCDKDNIGSAKSIKNNGAILENEIVKDGKTIQRYWIEIE